MSASLTVKQYWLMLRSAARTSSRRFGFDIQASSVEIRGLAAISAAQTAVIFKILVSKGIITDAEIQAAFQDAVLNNTWEPEPVEPVLPEPTITPPPTE